MPKSQQKIDDSHELETLNPQLTLRKYWHSPINTLAKSDVVQNIWTFVAEQIERMVIASQHIQLALKQRRELDATPKAQNQLKPEPDPKVFVRDSTLTPRPTAALSLSAIKFHISEIHSKINSIKKKYHVNHQKIAGLQLKMNQHRQHVFGVIANTFRDELGMELNREQMHSMYIVCQQFVRTQPTILNIQTDSEYMRLGASIVTADRLRLAFERRDLQPIMEQHVVRQDGLQRQVDTLLSRQNELLFQLNQLRGELMNLEGVSNRMGAAVEWVAAARELGSPHFVEAESENGFGMTAAF